MNLKKSQDRIGKLMLRFIDEIRVATAMGKRDINCVSENVLIQLFSEIYEHTDLKNLNVSEGSNFPAIDLGDKKTRTAYQITSTPSSEKVKRTLEKFVARELYKEYDRLVIYILTEKQSRYQSKKIDEIINGKFTFDKKNDILDYSDLLKEISGFSLEKTRRVEHILEQHFGEGQTGDEPQDILDWLEQVNNLWGWESGAIKINREELRNGLLNFASRGNGVVIGSPGVGKTFLLKELHQYLKSNEIPHLLLPIDRLGNGTPEDLENGLSYKGNLIERLKSVPVSDKKAILLFDAFDAARDEQTRKCFLSLIQQAIHKLSESWNIIVTVRTYDATKSQELLDLFGNLDEADLTQYQSEDIPCRHFTIPPFNKNEILQALSQIGCPKSVYDDGSDDFKKILAKPFNLWLLEKILSTLPDKDIRRTFSKVRSEVQLLDLFWSRRIEAADNENDRLSVLEEIALEMVEQCSLSIRQINVRKTLIQTAWNDLLSDEILTKVSSTGKRVAFSHNILFDYAISVLLIDDEPQHLENFILEDPSRPLFLRPSLTYFFTRLWYYKDSASFWRAFWHILQRDQSVPLRLVAHLVPTSVIANEAHDIDQLTPPLEKLQSTNETANKAIMWLLQSLRTLQIESDTLWIDFFDQISLHLHSDFAWDLATLTSDILERARDENVKDTCGRIGRRLLEWVWQEKETNESDWYDRFGSYGAVPLVAKTYHTNIEESRALLEKVLELLPRDNFPIDFPSRLTEHVDKIWAHDPEFVASVYRAVFTHYEISDEEIHRGGFILPFRSFRRQDYRMCQYRLVKHLPNFLCAAPSTTVEAVIRSLNNFIIHTRIDKPLEGLIETFNFRGELASFVQDGSHIWDRQKAPPEPIKLANALFDYIVELAKLEDPLFDSILDIFRDEVQIAFFWKRLLKIASQFPKVFAPRLFELCIAKPIQLHFEVSYELGLFLKAAASEFTQDKLLQIEESILAIPEETEDNQESLKLRRNRLLAQIPADLLLTDKAKEIREDMERENSVPVNRPPVSVSVTSQPFTEEMWFQEQGVDTTTPENQELRRFFESLDKFSSDWRNDAPTQEATRLILPRLQEAHAILKSNTRADQKVIDSLWRKLTDCIAILGRVAKNLESESFTFCRQVLLAGAEHEQPKPNPIYDEQFDYPGYSPYPRHDAARGLLRLASHQPDREILDAIEVLARDPVPSVCMEIAMELPMIYVKAPERFWHIMDKMATHEENCVVQECLYGTLDWIVTGENEDKITHIIAKLLEHTPSPPSPRVLGTSDPFIDLLMWLAIDRENSWALEVIEDTFFKDPIRFTNILTRLVSQVVEDYVVPNHLKTPDGRKRIKRATKCVSKAITTATDGIAKLCVTPKEQRTEEVGKQLQNLYEVIDEVITRLYFGVAHKRDQSEEPVKEISRKLRCDYYNEVKPLMKQVIAFAQDPKSGAMFAPTAHYFMQLLKSFLGCNPKEVLHLATGVVKSSEPFGYNLDSIAVHDVVEFVEIVLADYRHEVRDGEALEDLLQLLDLFAKIGWSDALKLVWRLDEVFR
ncbi:MAG: SMEK domain-containing protein [Candidatus Poribacteria bacterium]|nr:SMEK domain-containing protein [Candidatus Poribacteria bacterium]